MRYKIEELKDITDSREIMQSKPNGFSRYMTYIIIVLLVGVIVWSILANKEIVVKASGVVRPTVEVAKLSSSVNGIVTEVNISEGLEVKKGDVLLVINGEEYELQKKSLEESWIYVNIVDTKTQIFMQFFLKHLQAVEESYNRYCYEAFFCCTRILYIQI